MSRTKKAVLKVKLARKARKAAAKAKAAANGPKNTGVATKKLETPEGQTLPTKSVPKSHTEGSVDGVVSEQPATPAAPVAQSE